MSAAAALKELEQLRGYIRHGSHERRAFVPTLLSVEAVKLLTADPSRFKAAARDLSTAAALARRDDGLGPVMDDISGGLRDVVDRLAAGTITIAAALGAARGVLSDGLSAAYEAGAQSEYGDYSLGDVPDDAADVHDRLNEEASWLPGLLQAAAAGTISEAQLNARLALWAQQARGAYEAGKGAGAMAQWDDEAPDDEADTSGSRFDLVGALGAGALAVAGALSARREPIFQWVAVGDKDTCGPCGDRDGQEFTISELDATWWPGDGGFGKDTDGCEGGPLCRCIAIRVA